MVRFWDNGFGQLRTEFPDWTAVRLLVEPPLHELAVRAAGDQRVRVRMAPPCFIPRLPGGGPFPLNDGLLVRPGVAEIVFEVPFGHEDELVPGLPDSLKNQCAAGVQLSIGDATGDLLEFDPSATLLITAEAVDALPTLGAAALGALLAFGGWRRFRRGLQARWS